MKSVQIEKQVLFEWIEKNVAKMRHLEVEVLPPSGIMSGLRELQLSLNPLMLGKVDPSTRFIAFFLNTYVKAIFMDLLGDIPDDADGVLQNIRENLFKTIAEYLDNLIILLKNNDNPLPVLEKLVSLYSAAVNDLNYKDIQLGGPR